MARNETPPFARGKTYYEAGAFPYLVAPTTDDHFELEGKTWVFEDVDWSQSASGVKVYRSGRYVTCMCVRNVSGGALHPKLLGHMNTSGGATITGTEFLGQVDSEAPALGDRAYPIDEFLPAAGVLANDYFWVVVGGTAKVTTDTAGTTTITPGLHVVAGGGTAGRVVAQNTGVAAGAATFAQVNGDIGTAITNTNGNSQDLLIDVRPWFMP